MSQTQTVVIPSVSKEENNFSTLQRHQYAIDQSGNSRHLTEELEIEPESNPVEDETQYPTGLTFWLVILSMGLSLIVEGMDSSIVAIAVPALTDHFHTVKDVGWYSAAYRLCFCSFQFMFGKIYKLFPTKRVFLLSMVIFLVGSVLCATASSSLGFLVGRAVCGFAGSGIVAGVLALLVQTVPLRKRPLYTGITVGLEGVAAVSAPVLGGVLVERLSWRWCFWINLPLCGIALATVMFVLHDIRPVERRTWKQILKELDLVGTLVFLPSLTCFFVALQIGGSLHPWSSPTVIALFSIFAILLAVFAVDQWVKQDAATLPPRILGNRSILAGFIFALCCNGAMNVIEYYLPSYFQSVKGFSSAKTGYLIVPLIVGFMTSTILSGALLNQVGYYVPFMLATSVLMPVFCGMITASTAARNIVSLTIYSGVFGFAAGIGFQSPKTAVQYVLPPEDVSIGFAILIFSQTFGAAVFIVLAQTVFTSRLTSNLKGVAPGLNGTSIENMGLTELRGHIPAELEMRVFAGLDESLVQAWYVAVALSCVTVVGSLTMEWRKVKVKRS